MREKNQLEERYELEEEIREAIQNPVEIPENVEKKIQDTYAEIRKTCQEQGTASEMTKTRRHVGRKMFATLAAAGILATATLTVLAANGFFTKQMELEGDTVSWSFDIDYDLQPVSVTAVPTYLPEGMIEQEEGKYCLEDNWGHGISIIPLTTVNIDKMDISWDDVETVEETTLCGMEANVVSYKERDKYMRPTNIYLFNEEEGYVIWVWGDYSVDPEELRKVADGLEITVTEDESLSYLTDEEKAEETEIDATWAESMQARNEAGLTADDVAHPGDILSSSIGDYSVRNAYVADSLSEISGYTENGVYDLESLNAWLNEDGTLRSYTRQRYSDGELVEEEEIGQKFLVVEATVTAQEGLFDRTPLDARLVCLETREDGSWTWSTDIYSAVPSEQNDLQIDNRCIYIDQPDGLEGDERAHQFFWKALENGETLDYVMVFVVDEDWVADGDLSNLMLNFNGVPGSDLEPNYYALQ